MNPALALQLHRLFLRTAFACAQIFAWLFIYHFLYLQNLSAEDAIVRTVLLYALSQGVTCLLTPYSALRLRNGVRAEIIIAALFAAAAFVILGSTLNDMLGSGSAVGMLAFAVLLGVYRALYWVPYSVERVETTGAAPRSLIIEMFIALVPAISGSVIAFAIIPPSILLYVAATLVVVAIVPLLRLRETQEGYSWKYFETFGVLFSRPHRKLFFISILQGLESAVLLLLWPIAILTLTSLSYTVVGVVLSITFLIAILLRGTAFNMLRYFKLHDSPAIAAAIAASAWVGRLLVVTPASIILVDVYHLVGVAGHGAAPIHFEQAADSAHYIDEYTALKEIGLSLGRIIMCLVAASFALSFSILFAFVTCFGLAAIAAASGIVLARSPKKTI